MKIKELIQDIILVTPWVDRTHSRDHILWGNKEDEIKKIGVCWVATKKVLQQAKDLGINFIISHENFLYIEGTHLFEGYYQAREEKIRFCYENGITVYRLHDGWDQFPEYGISDNLAKVIGLPFETREISSMYQICNINKTMTIGQIAQKFADGLSKYGCNHVDVLGDVNKKVDVLAIGTGAATDISIMHKMGGQAMMISDDGGSNFTEQQWCLDNDIPLIIVHHSVNEMAGIDGMQKYFAQKYPEIEVIRLEEGYKYTTIISGKN